VAAALFLSGPVFAVPTHRAEPTATPSATPVPSGLSVLALDSSLLFVLDDPISSKTTRTGDEVRAHLKDALIIGGLTVASAGAPVKIKVSDVRGAHAPDVDGSVDIFFEPLTLSNNATLPLRTPTAHISVHMTAGAASTAGITDTLKDIFIPYHYLYRMLRKGANVELAAGTLIRARTAATIDGSHGTISVIEPPPFHLSADAPHANYKPLPFYTGPPKNTPSPKPSPTPSPQPSNPP